METELPMPKPLSKQNSGFQPVKNIIPIQIVSPKKPEIDIIE